MAISIDCGSYNLVACTRDEKNNFLYKREVNAFIEIPLTNRFVFNMMKNAKTPEFPDGIPLIERENVAYALGEAAVNMAYTMSSIDLKRPMVSGCVNPKERNAFEILKVMIHSLIDAKKDNEVLYYCIPSNAINEETDVDYHNKILESIFKAYRSEEGFKVVPRPINEALALVYAEGEKKAFTGLGISFGSGMVNACYAMYGSPVFQFSIVNSGDWIDKQAAKATGESITFINKEKNKIDLSKPPETLIQRAIHTQYRLMLENTVIGLKKGFENINKTVRTDTPIDIIIAGGTASPNGFKELFEETIKQANLPIAIDTIIKPKEPLYSVAKGILIAAENS